MGSTTQEYHKLQDIWKQRVKENTETQQRWIKKEMEDITQWMMQQWKFNRFVFMFMKHSWRCNNTN
jgi:hypothetical protein